MEEKLANLEKRVGTIETLQMDHMAQTTSIKKDTADLLETFNALKGAWTVLNWIGKAAKPLTVIGGLFGAWYTIKGIK